MDTFDTCDQDSLDEDLPMSPGRTDSPSEQCKENQDPANEDINMVDTGDTDYSTPRGPLETEEDAKPPNEEDTSVTDAVLEESSNVQER